MLNSIQKLTHKNAKTALVNARAELIKNHNSILASLTKRGAADQIDEYSPLNYLQLKSDKIDSPYWTPSFSMEIDKQGDVKMSFGTDLSMSILVDTTDKHNRVTITDIFGITSGSYYNLASYVTALIEDGRILENVNA